MTCQVINRDTLNGLDDIIFCPNFDTNRFVYGDSQRLLLKLRHYGIGDSTLQWVQSFLPDRSQQVLVEGYTSESFPVTQEMVFGPLLFHLYTNDMQIKLSSTALLFADDSLLYRRIRSSQYSTNLQENLDRLQQWENELTLPNVLCEDNKEAQPNQCHLQQS